MKDKINSILSEAKGKISDAVSEGELQNVKSAYIGKQGSLSLLMKEIPTVDVALRPEMGKLLFIRMFKLYFSLIVHVKLCYFINALHMFVLN